MGLLYMYCLERLVCLLSACSTVRYVRKEVGLEEVNIELECAT